MSHEQIEVAWPGRSDYTIEEIPQLWADLDDTYTEYNLLPDACVTAAVGESSSRLKRLGFCIRLGQAAATTTRRV
jgi:hypothetical protein